MSWDVFIFKANQIVNCLEDLEESNLVDIGTWQDFKNLLLQQFPKAAFDGNWCIIEGEGFSLETSLGSLNEMVSNTIFHLYGVKAIYPLVALCQRNNWQAFDCSADIKLNFDKPEEIGYLNFTTYLAQIKQTG